MAENRLCIHLFFFCLYITHSVLVSWLGLHMLAFLVEVLEKGMQQVQVPVLNIIHCMLHYIDLSSQHAQPISGDLIRVIAKYLDVSQMKLIKNTLSHIKIFKFI